MSMQWLNGRNLSGLGFWDDAWGDVIDWGSSIDIGDAAQYDWAASSGNYGFDFATDPAAAFDWTADDAINWGAGQDFDIPGSDWSWDSWGATPAPDDWSTWGGLDTGNATGYGDVNINAGIPTGESAAPNVVAELGMPSSGVVSPGLMPDFSGVNMNDVLGFVKQGFTLWQAYEHIQNPSAANTRMPPGSRPYTPGQRVPAGYRVQSITDPITGQRRQILTPANPTGGMNNAARWNPQTQRFEPTQASLIPGVSNTVLLVGGAAVGALLLLGGKKRR